MCTLTWALGPDGFDLFFNRDEALTRQRALPPTVTERDGLSVAAPTDADAGGTWIAVNSRGLALCLLNGYSVTDGGRAAPVSRGLLVSSLASAPTCADAARRVRSLQLKQYRSFHLVAFEPGQAPLQVSWDGRSLGARSLRDTDRPLSSSSLDPAGASENRRDLLRGLERAGGRLEAADLEAFHRGHLPVAGAQSVCMHRDDAHTVSLTHVSVSPDSVLLHYCPEAPCGGAPFETVRMRRLTLSMSGGSGRG